MFKVNNKDTRTTAWRCSGIFIVDFEHISDPCSTVSIVNFEQVNRHYIFQANMLHHF